MKLRSLILAVTLFVTAAPTFAQTPESAAESAAIAWLGLVDAGDYAESWSAASTLFRQSVTEAQWQAAVAGVREPLGPLTSRKVQSATFKDSLPGAPDGEYVVIVFTSSFANKATAIETVTPMKDADGEWRVSGYFIR
jgi:hypothetical protein